MKPSIIAAALREAGFRAYTDRRAARKAPCCTISLKDVAERRLPMGRIERRSRFCVTYTPEPMAEAIGFGACEAAEAQVPISALCRVLELIKTPDGLLRGHGIECAVKDGMTVVTAVYTELLRETEKRKPKMGSMELTMGSPQRGEPDLRKV
jgi:hypothetical protein